MGIISTELASDSFNRAAGDLGANWMQVDGAFLLNILTPGVVGAVNQFVTCSSIYTAIPDWPDDQYSEVTFGTQDAGGGNIGPVLRTSMQAGIDFQGYVVTMSGPTDNATACSVSMAVWNGSAGTTYGPFNLGPTKPGDKLRVTVMGTDFTFELNGVTVGTATDATWATGQPGLSAIAFNTTSQMTRWEGGKLVDPDAGASFVRRNRHFTSKRGVF